MLGIVILYLLPPALCPLPSAITRAQEIAKQFESQGQQQSAIVAALIEAQYKAIEQVRMKSSGTQFLELA